MAPSKGDHRRVSPLADALAGGLSGGASAIVTAPLDTLKVRLQSRASATSAPRMLFRIVATEGGRALFSGLRPSLVALVPNWAIFFSSWVAPYSGGCCGGH